MRTHRIGVWPAIGSLVLLAIGAFPRAGAHAAGLELAGRDTTCSPCKDFYQYANGGWLARTSIPASYRTFGSFEALHDRNEDALHALLESAARSESAPPTENIAKLGIFYGTCMDSAGAESEGSKPIEAELMRITGLKAKSDLAAEVAHLHAQGVGVLFRFGSAPDFKNSSLMIAVAGQGGLGLPDRDYYTKQDSVSRRIRSAYEDHVGKILRLVGTPPEDARAGAAQVMAIETALVQASMTNVERRDPKAVYHKMSVGDLKSLAPAFDWGVYLSGVGLSTLADLNVAQPQFFKRTGALLDSIPLADWKTYFRWHLVHQAAPYLSSAFVNEDFHLAQLLGGTEEQLPRWKRCERATDESMGEALGEEYVKQQFTPEAKTRALEMVRNLEGVLHDRIASLEWMSDSTRAQALIKLEAFGNKIGYPDRWRDYSTLRVESGPFVMNHVRAQVFETRRQLGRVGKPVDKGEWRMTPPTVNAYYNSSGNDINFPAGILQPPFFDAQADDAVNYGGMGAVIGHEMTHGFDDRGRQFDARGNLRDWWTAQDAKRYQERAAKVVNQFNGFVAVDTLHVNGKLTLGENIADLGGLAIAYGALENSLQNKPRPLIDGLTPEQRFFLSYAAIWRRKYRPEEARTRVTTDSHSPARWRVNGPLSNLPEFARAFGCKAGDPMVRPDSLQARIW